MPVEASELTLQKVGNYHLVEKIADGGMGSVYKGRHPESGEFVAVKVIPKHLASNIVFVKRFEMEYNAAKALDHPNVVKALEFGRQDDLPYLVMEYVAGESLGQRLEREGKLPEAEAIRIITQVAQGLHKAHKLGLVHRDVKPDNILLTADGQAKLTDLGLVKEIESDLNLTRTGRGLGTPHFMAPEQFRRAKQADTRCDIYSMAATLYMMVTGELPFGACGPLDAWMRKINNDLAPPRQVNKDLSERLDWAIRRSMSADPAARASNCREFVEDLTGQSTRRLTGTQTDSELKSLWFLVYKDETGVVHTVKGSTSGIRRSLREGLLGDATNIRISRQKDGPFDPLRQHAEFRDLLIEPVAATTPNVSKTPVTQPKPSVRMPRPVSPTPIQVATPTLTHASAHTPQDAPVIRLHAPQESPEWVKLAALIFIAIATGIAGFFLMPLLTALRLF